MAKILLTLVAALLVMLLAASGKEPATFRVAEFNVNGGYDNWKERLPGVVETMLKAEASIYLLNEAHEEENEDRQILRELRRQSHDRWMLVRGDGGNHFIIDSGKYKVLRTKTVLLPHARHYSELNLRHRKTGTRFWTWNTHLIAANRTDRPFDAARLMRKDQSAVIAERLQRLYRSIGGGDINDGAEGRVAFAKVGHHDVRDLTDNVTNAEWNSHERYNEPNKMGGRWLDLLAAGSLTDVNAVGLINSGDASDHNLIWSTVTIS